MSWAVVPGSTVPELVETITEGARTVTVAAADTVLSLTEVAVTVTVRLLAGGADGAL